MKYLITGGAGYIGSTICSALEDEGHTPIILDSLITGRIEFTRGRIFYQADIADSSAVEKIFREHPDIQAVVHCAALIVVPESMAKPYEYYRENVAKSLELFRTLRDLGCKRIVFSSSAALYDVVPGFMVTEDSPLKPISPYARTKLMMEMILKDFCAAYGMRGIALRYFNPIGADPQDALRHPREGPLAHHRQAGGYRPGQAAGLRDHRHRLPHPGWHRRARLHPRLGSGPRAHPRPGAF